MTKEIYFAGGCFWGVEKYFSLIPGVTKTETGYANGRTDHPTYREVCEEDTGHAEAVRVFYDSELISLAELLDLFFRIIDPTALNRQGPDVGTQYRTGIYYQAEDDRPIVSEALNLLQKKYSEPVVVEVKQLINYTPAESYHQGYLDHNPTGYCHIPRPLFDLAAAYSKSKYTKKEASQLKNRLTDLQYYVTQQNGTEQAFKNEYYNKFQPGIYVDITTGEPLFQSTDKFESGCGWPSFSRPINKTVIKELTDTTHGMIRTEVRSRTGDAHLGHVFTDGPEESGGLRYCINSAALKFIPRDEMAENGYGEYL